MLALAGLARAKASECSIRVFEQFTTRTGQVGLIAKARERKVEDELVIRDSMAATSTRTKVWTTDKYSSMFPVFLSR